MAYNNHHYGKWVCYYLLSVSFLPSEKYRFSGKKKTPFRRIFWKENSSLAGLRYSFHGIQTLTEHTINLGSKLKKMWLNLLENESSLYRPEETSTILHGLDLQSSKV